MPRKLSNEAQVNAIRKGLFDSFKVAAFLAFHRAGTKDRNGADNHITLAEAVCATMDGPEDRWRFVEWLRRGRIPAVIRGLRIGWKNRNPTGGRKAKRELARRLSRKLVRERVSVLRECRAVLAAELEALKAQERTHDQN